jgi:hypothetical protein
MQRECYHRVHLVWMTASAWKAPCEDGATFPDRDIVIATGRCTRAQDPT